MHDNFEMFPLESNNCKIKILPMIVEHVSILEEKLSNCFLSINTVQYDWITNPFVETAIDFSLMLTEKEQAAIFNFVPKEL